ncbi:MAG: hypothetical protein ACREQA_20700 [Candidatus Binatia bacterium]
MNKEELGHTIYLAHKFAQEAEKLLDSNDEYWEIRGNKQTGKVRRLSMDLTRQLAELRKS